jgi:hypothetical protein
MQWFRLYHRMVDNDKLRLLAFEDRWHFVAICCLKASGLIDEPDSDIRSRKIAVKLGVQLRELDEITRRLREVDLVDNDLQPTAWDELQFKTDNSTSRVKAFREKQQKQTRNAVKRPRNVSVTVQETDTDTDTEVLVAKATCASEDARDLKPSHVFDEWNKIAASFGKPAIRDRTPARVQLVKGRISQYPIEDFILVFSKVERSAFLRDGKFCTFDFIMKRANFIKILEGNYDND